MGFIFRFIFFIVIGYLVLRWLRGWLQASPPQPSQPSASPKQPTSAFPNAEIVDVKYVELPQEPKTEKNGA